MVGEVDGRKVGSTDWVGLEVGADGAKDAEEASSGTDVDGDWPTGFWVGEDIAASTAGDTGLPLIFHLLFNVWRRVYRSVEGSRLSLHTMGGGVVYVHRSPIL